SCPRRAKVREGRMADPPRERRRPKPARASVPDDDVDEPKSSPRAPAKGSARDTGPGPGWSLAKNGPVWPLIAGLAIGFARGRAPPRFGLSDTRPSGAAAEGTPPSIAAEPAKRYASMAEFPSGWLKDGDLGAASSHLAGLTDAQKVTVMQALNERNCECGCGM